MAAGFGRHPPGSIPHQRQAVRRCGNPQYTERRLVNEELVAAQREAERANRAKSRFLATASHDLRQPMQTIQLLNASMLKFVPEPRGPPAAGSSKGQAIETMTRLLNALLDISRLESGAIEPVSV